MEGNGMFQENEQGYGNGWGNFNRRNDNQSFMQRGSYFDSQGSMGGFGRGNMGSGQNMSGPFGSNMGPQRMSFGYGGMDMPGDDGEYNSGRGSYSGYDDNMDQPGGRKGFDNYDGPDMQQNSFNKRGNNNPSSQKGLLEYEGEMAMMQGGSYAGSSPYGKKRSKDDNSFSGPQSGGNFDSFGPKSSFNYKSMGPPDFGPFSHHYNHQGPPRRSFGFGDFDSGPGNSLLDDSRYRLGSGNFPGRGGGMGFGRGRGGGWRFGKRGDNFQNRGQKRDGPPQGPYPKKKKSITQGQKNPVSFLNEIRPDANFQVGDMEGSSNNPTFTVSLEFDGETYTATAKSKKLAKRYVSEAALKVYLNTPAAQQLGYNESMIEFSEGPESGVAKGAENAVVPKEESESTTPKPVVDDGGKNPVMHLNELRKDAVYDLKEETGQAHNKQFVMRVTVSGQTFEGSGQSKKLAKAAAAREALKELGLLKQE